MKPSSVAEPTQNQALAPIYQIVDLVVDTGRATVSRDGQELPLPRLSFDLLVALIEAAPRIASPDELMDRVWRGLVVGPETVSQRVKLLRDSLGDDPKAPRYVAGVRGRGYRLLPAVTRLDTAGAATVAAAPIPATTARAATRWQLILPILTLAIVAAAGIWILVDRSRDLPAPDDASALTPLPARSVAVLAFEDRGGAEGTAILAEGIPETVLHQLSRFPGLTVIARGSSFAFQDQGDDLRVIGRKLNVRYLLEGSVQTASRRLRVTSSLVDAETGASVWSMQFDRALQDVFAVQDEIATEVARAMQITLDAGPDGAASLQHGATQSYEAYLAFLRGRALLANVRIADLPAAVESLAAAMRHDPSFAAAYVLLARAQVALAEQTAASAAPEAFAKAVEAALRLLDEAIALDPEDGEAFVERGYLKAYFDVAAADADLRRGIELSPNYARGYEGLAAVLFQSVARRREALEMLEKARRLDPLDPRLDVIKSTYLHYGAGDTHQAVGILRTVLERNPLYVPALVRLGNLRWHIGAHAESILLVEQAVALDGGNETAWRQLAANYLEVDDLAAAESSFDRIGGKPAQGWLSLHLYRKDWRRAGEAAYAMIGAGSTHPPDERRLTLAIRMHARTTGDYARAIRTLEQWALVEWEGDTPLLGGQLDEGISVAGLADLLAATGQQERASALAEELLADTDVQMGRYGRGEIWLNDGRAMALTLLGRPEDAMLALQRQAKFGVILHEWRFMLADEPVFDTLRKRADFQALLANARANVARERQQLERMRADGLVPTRTTTEAIP